jgi:peptidoglycan/xylan/chitin deacetylase (PgdA/CDA1 family)/SAM-dependent methyltransferase
MAEHRVPVIMMYHSVRHDAERSIFRIAIDPKRFRDHIDFLTAHYRVVPLAEFVDSLASRSRSAGMAAITFDDGFADNLAIARDILDEYRAAATVFVPTGFVGRPYFWWDALYEIHSAGMAQPDRALTELRAQFPGLDLGTEPNDWFTPVWDHLRRSPLDGVYESVGELAVRFGAPLDGLPRPVTASELTRLAGWPIEIGSHAISHRPLTALSIADARHEIAASRDWLTAHLRQPVAAFSYPFGLLDRETAQHCRSAGYACAVGIAPAHRHLSYNDVYDLPRVDAANGEVGELAAELDIFERANVRSYASRAAAASALDITPERRAIYSPRAAGAAANPPVSTAGLFRSTPVNRLWGFGQGVPLDRPFIRRFIETHRGDVRGRILEIKESEYSREYARPESRTDILDIDPENPRADIIDDLQTGATIPDETYDCVVLTQVLQLIPDPAKAIATVSRILRPGGVLLLTAPGITQTAATTEGEFFWSFFKPGLKQLLAGHFDDRKLLLAAHGNAGLAASFLMGMTAKDVPPELFADNDPEYPIVLTARAAKPLAVPPRLSWPNGGQKRVSVIIPMFNAAGTIRETLFSVSRQSCHDYEVVVVDDGSTDGSRDIVEEIARGSGGRITVIEHAGGANRGLALSRDHGIRHASGEFVVFLDADDTIHPEKLAHDLEILTAHPQAAAVVGRALWWWDGAGEQEAHLDTIMEPADRVVDPPAFFNTTYQLESGGVPPCVHSWMVRKAALDKVEPFDPAVMTYEDQKYLAELSLRFPIYVAGTCLCEYRRRERTLWADAVTSGSDTTARSRFLEWKRQVVETSPAYSRRRSCE